MLTLFGHCAAARWTGCSRSALDPTKATGWIDIGALAKSTPQFPLVKYQRRSSDEIWIVTKISVGRNGVTPISQRISGNTQFETHGFRWKSTKPLLIAHLPEPGWLKLVFLAIKGDATPEAKPTPETSEATPTPEEKLDRVLRPRDRTVDYTGTAASRTATRKHKRQRRNSSAPNTREEYEVAQQTSPPLLQTPSPRGRPSIATPLGRFPISPVRFYTKPPPRGLVPPSETDSRFPPTQRKTYEMSIGPTFTGAGTSAATAMDFLKDVELGFAMRGVAGDAEKLAEVKNRFRYNSPADVWFRSAALGTYAAFVTAFEARFTPRAEVGGALGWGRKFWSSVMTAPQASYSLVSTAFIFQPPADLAFSSGPETIVSDFFKWVTLNVLLFLFPTFSGALAILAFGI
ncbi:hypothetical protein B0H13DRAFT_1859319 [Mycena leptocephala]|nr:hypothetical protein B0H13DRAFT_1859319 [Mycena leptocephala]